MARVALLRLGQQESVVRQVAQRRVETSDEVRVVLQGLSAESLRGLHRRDAEAVHGARSERRDPEDLEQL